MAYFIFQKNLDNVENTLYRIAANESDLNNVNINQSNYKIIEDSDANFNAVKYSTKQAFKYNQNIIYFMYEIYEVSTKCIISWIFFSNLLYC